MLIYYACLFTESNYRNSISQCLIQFIFGTFIFPKKNMSLIIFPFFSHYSAVSLCLKGIAVTSEVLNISWRKTMIKFSHDTPMTAAAAAKSLQSCLTLCDPRDGSPPGSPIPGILQARTLEWIAIAFSNEWKWKWKWSRSVVSDS